MIRKLTECPECGADPKKFEEYKAELEIQEGPHRGDSGIANVSICEECGYIVYVQRETPTIEADDE